VKVALILSTLIGGIMQQNDVIMRLKVDNIEILSELFGKLDEHTQLIEETYMVSISSRDGDVLIVGTEEAGEKVKTVLNSLVELIKMGEHLDAQKVLYAMSLLEDNNSEKLAELYENVLCVTSKGRFIKAKTLGQQSYIEAIKKNDVVFGIGPAGTGKTFLAVAMAVKAFKNKDVARIIITRPAVEAGESLGFLPGDLQQKVDPYLRPLYDSLYEILGVDNYLKYKERGMIEVVPLAYMRGRTLDNAFIILDEAQNTTVPQMKMFLTRFGFGSKVVVNGDVTQQDLPPGKKSGLVNASEVLSGVPGIGFVHLTDKDVVRHEMVKRIIKEYEKYENKISSQNKK
jgi:phosphate starvation-inducible PhoH-like protein